MKKSLLAIAVAGVFAGAAQAQSSVTVYGTVDLGLTSGNDKVAASSTTQTVTNYSNSAQGKGGLSTSLFGLRGSEDLGGGMKANFVVEYGLNDLGTGATGDQAAKTSAAATTTTAGTAFADARYTWLGLSSKNGELRLGRQAQSVHGVVVGGSVGGGNNVVGAMYSGGTNAAPNTASIRPQNVYINRAVTYISPTFNGITIQVQRGEQDVNSALNTTTAATTAATDTGASINFVYQKLTAAVGISQITNATASTAANKYNLIAYNATYDFGVAKVFGVGAQGRNTNMAGANLGSTNLYEFGVSVPVTSAISVWGSGLGGKRTSDATSASATASVSGAGGVANATTAGTYTIPANVSGFQVGVKYSLSKRSTLYAIGGQQSIKGTGVGNGWENNAAQYILGMNHTF